MSLYTPVNENPYSTPGGIDRWIKDAYSGIGRTGFGNDVSNIDEGGFNFWSNYASTPGMTQDTFNKSFNNSVNQYVAQKPDDPLTQYVQNYQSGAPSPAPMPNPQTGLTLTDVESWWKEQQAAQQNGVGTDANSLSQLFPRTNWGNYQTSQRGGRYFDPTSGKYQGLGNLPQTQTASL